ncbi:MAG: hypothetical protein JWP69_1355 [Flaviaesturariibacter sp.]|nr:hypothetical protein [Flaviaesturariibacter sp.]
MFFQNWLEKKSSSNAAQVTLQLLRNIKVPVTATEVIDKLEHHPDFPSLYSISDSLKGWKVDNLALQVEPEKLDHLPVPFITHRKKKNDFVLVRSVNGAVEYVNSKGKLAKASRSDFEANWGGVVLLAEGSRNSGQLDYTRSRRKEWVSVLRIPLLVGIGIGGVLAFALVTGILWPTLFLALSLAGTVIAGLLLWFEVDKSNPFLQQVCSGGANTNCSAVLASKGAKLFSWLSWSEVGFFYFTGSFIMLLVSLGNGLVPAFELLSLLSLLATPYILFSISYQAKVAKQWCPLCLGVQAVLLMQAVVGFSNLREAGWKRSFISSLSGVELTLMLFSFALPVIFWMMAKAPFKAVQAEQKTGKELRRLKYNKEIFEALLAKQKRVTVSPDGLGIILGNPQAATTIIKVCNPYCGPCAKAHEVLEELLRERDNIKLQIIFSATTGANDRKALPVKHFMGLDAGGSGKLIQKALHEWYISTDKNYETFASQYPLTQDILAAQEAGLVAMGEWYLENEINFTPTIFVNNYQLPDIYSVKDLKYLL